MHKSTTGYEKLWMMPGEVIPSPQETTIGSDPRVWRGAHIYTRCNDTRNDSCHSIQSRAAVKPHGVKQTQLMSRETLQGSVETLVSLYLQSQPCCRPIGWVYAQGGEEAADQSPACWEGIYRETRWVTYSGRYSEKKSYPANI